MARDILVEINRHSSRTGERDNRAPMAFLRCVFWSGVFALNMIVPLMFGLPSTEEHGRLARFSFWVWAFGAAFDTWSERADAGQE